MCLHAGRAPLCSCKPPSSTSVSRLGSPISSPIAPVSDQQLGYNAMHDCQTMHRLHRLSLSPTTARPCNVMQSRPKGKSPPKRTHPKSGFEHSCRTPNHPQRTEGVSGLLFGADGPIWEPPTPQHPTRSHLALFSIVTSHFTGPQDADYHEIGVFPRASNTGRIVPGATT